MDAKVSTSISVFGRTAASVLAGGVGSAIGVFVAYPIDVLKTKAQIKACNNNTNSSSSNNNKTIKNDSVFEIVRNIYKIEGIGGFFNGVLTTMIGNALVSAVSFSANELAISVLNATSLFGGSPDSRAVTPFIILLLAACFSGFVQTFVVIPVGESYFFFVFVIYHIIPSHLKGYDFHISYLLVCYIKIYLKYIKNELKL
jgi:hypothetical protein